MLQLPGHLILCLSKTRSPVLTSLLAQTLSSLKPCCKFHFLWPLQWRHLWSELSQHFVLISLMAVPSIASYYSYVCICSLPSRSWRQKPSERANRKTTSSESPALVPSGRGSAPSTTLAQPHTPWLGHISHDHTHLFVPLSPPPASFKVRIFSQLRFAFLTLSILSGTKKVLIKCF